MSFGAGFGAGIGVGMGSGIATGMASGMTSGRNSTRVEIENNLRAFAETHTITIRDNGGREVPFSEFVGEVVKESEEPNKKAAALVAVCIGILLFLLAGGLALFLIMR